MASHQRELSGSVDALLAHLDDRIIATSATAKVEDGSDQEIGDARMVVRVYERYSLTGSSRVSLGISILAVGERLAVSVISSGGSEAVLFKLNTFGEEAFLDRAIEALDSFGTDDRGAGSALL